MKHSLAQTIKKVFFRGTPILSLLMVMASFCSCTNDQYEAMTLSGTWQGDLGIYISDSYGERYDSYQTIIEFVSNGIGSTSGTGYEIDRYSGAPWKYTYNPIEWTISNGVIAIYYPRENYYVRIHDYSLTEYHFSGYMDDNTYFNLTNYDSFNWSYYNGSDYGYGYDSYAKTRGASIDTTKYKMGCKHNVK